MQHQPNEDHFITMIATINALGNAIHPYYIFPRVNFQRHMLDLAPTASTRTAAPNGWVFPNLFPNWVFPKKYSQIL